MSSSHRSSHHSSKGKHYLSKSKSKKDDWSDITDPEERRRVQNRIAQRKFRDKAKEAKERQDREAENRAHSENSYDTPDPGEMGTEEELSGLPWGSLSLKHAVSKGKAKEDESRGGSRRHEDRNYYKVSEPIYEEREAYYETDSYYEDDRAYYDYGSGGYGSGSVSKGKTSTDDSRPITGREILGHFSLQNSPQEQNTPTSSQGTHSKQYDSCETETDWGESSSPGNDGISETVGIILGAAGGDDRSEDDIKPILSMAKQQLVDELMEQFWIIFNQEWQSGIKSHGGEPSNTAGLPDSRTLVQRSSAQRPHKRRVDDQRSGDDDEGESAKRSSQGLFPADETRRRNDFACPYRKHDPRKYSVSNWRSCALTPLATVARVKGHLYRHHMIFQCPRCKELFENQTKLDDHFTAVKGCELSSADPADGITATIEKRLRSRKKTHPDQTEEDRWRGIYQILFPGEDIPSPYFEPIQEDLPQSPESQELANYEDYSRRELPRIFRRALEAALNDESQPIAERLLRQLPSMIQDCQDVVFSSYRARLHSDNTESPALPAEHGQRLETSEETQIPSTQIPSTPIPSTPIPSTCEHFYSPPSNESHLHSMLEVPDFESSSRYHEQNRAWDSGFEAMNPGDRDLNYYDWDSSWDIGRSR